TRSSGSMGWGPPPPDPPADPGLTRAFAACLPGGRLAGPLLAFASVGSTQAIGRDLAARGAPEGTILLADHQTAGRGQRGRGWTAPAGGALLFSCVLRPGLAPGRWPQLTLEAAEAVAEAVEATTGLRPAVKWPNDVLVGDRKLAGVLADGVVGPGPSASWVVLGIGVNVSQEADEWPAELSGRAVSLGGLGHPVSRPALLTAVLDRLALRYDALLAAADARSPARVAGRALEG
ncbi:MAG: biotin--[acetyl-CoA-carboxylase] ligase, partial [Candidatus Rokuibacteriota bacterium]